MVFNAPIVYGLRVLAFCETALLRAEGVMVFNAPVVYGLRILAFCETGGFHPDHFDAYDELPEERRRYYEVFAARLNELQQQLDGDNARELVAMGARIGAMNEVELAELKRSRIAAVTVLANLESGRRARLGG